MCDSSKIYTSEDILALIDNEDHYGFFDSIGSLGATLQYQLADTEIEWYEFVSGKYCIADYIKNNSDDNFVLSINDFGINLSIALDNDNHGYGKASCLSDNSALQAIFFFLYKEDMLVND